MSCWKAFEALRRNRLQGALLLQSAFLALLFLVWPQVVVSRPKIVAAKLSGAAAGSAAPEGLSERPGATWAFAVSGDSRNCGDVVIPAIAAGALAHRARFYWHLGDFRWGYGIDQDMAREAAYRNHPLNMRRYLANEWNDFIQNQLLPFGQTPVFLAIGNHELNLKTEQDYLIEFANWLNTPIIRNQRLEDNPADYGLRAYYHWRVGGIDFFSLDNASVDQFDTEQVRWFESVLKRDDSDPDVHTVVLGMHRALPYSVAPHSMDESVIGRVSGARVYTDLLQAERGAHKHVYILCAHLHLYMANIFNTPYWKSHGGVLPGWIVATAGATRAALPADSSEARAAMTRVYGYLLGTVNPPGSSEGTIRFKYYQVNKSDVPRGTVDKFVPGLVNWCFKDNYQGGPPLPMYHP